MDTGEQKLEPKFKMAAMYKLHTYGPIYACIHDSNEIPTALPMFLGSGNIERLVRKLSDVWVCWKSKMVAMNRKCIRDKSNISTCTHDSNGIQTAVPMFLGLGNTGRLLRILPGVWVC